MKKVLLTIFAVAITLASCKDYDDDFAALNQTIADLQAQVAGFSTLQTGLTSLQSSVASLQTTVNAIPTDQVDLSALESDLADALANIANLQADLDAIVADYATSDDITAVTDAIADLNAELELAQNDLTELLAANNVYDGDLSIKNAAQLAFAVGLDDKIMIINGFLDIDNDGLSAAEVAAVTVKILNVTGTVTVDNTTDGGVVDLSALTAIGGAVSVTGTGDVDFTALASVVGDYSVIGVDITDAALATVGGTYTLNYDGGYEQPNLTTVGGIVTLTDIATADPIVGTMAIDFSGLATSGAFTAGSLTYGVATSVKLNAGVTFTVTANAATVVDLLAANYVGLTVSATTAGSVITIAGTVNDAASTPAGLALNVTGSATSVLNAASVDQLTTLDTAGFDTITFPALTEATVVITSALSFTAADLVASTSFAGVAATDVSMASTPSFTAALVENLTFSALASDFASTSAVLLTADVTGAANTIAVSFTTTALTSATFAGEFLSVAVSGASALTALSTTGVINAFTLNASDSITAVSLAHTHLVGGSGSSLTVTNNDLLAALTTSSDFLLTLTVTGNALLATMDFSSYVNVVSSGDLIIKITGNKLTGDYTNAVPVTGTTSYVETTITSADLLTLRPFIVAFEAAIAGSTSTATLLSVSDSDGDTVAEMVTNFTVTIDDIDASTAGSQTLVAAMNADSGVQGGDNSGSINDDTTTALTGADSFANTIGIDTVTEFLLIQ